MPKRNFSTLEEFKANLHKEGATLVDFEGRKIPCILVDPKSYEAIIRESLGAPIGTDTVLDIFYDGQDVFVDVQMNFRKNREKKYFAEKNFLFYANEMLEFFETLSENGLIAIAPDSSTPSDSKVFIIQLPKKDAAERALQIIKMNANRRSRQS